MLHDNSDSEVRLSPPTCANTNAARNRMMTPSVGGAIGRPANHSISSGGGVQSELKERGTRGFLPAQQKKTDAATELISGLGATCDDISKDPLTEPLQHMRADKAFHLKSLCFVSRDRNPLESVFF